MSENILIIGAGISGLGANYSLIKKGIRPIILEKDYSYGGLCGSFETIPGFVFDRFVHLSFSKNAEVIEIFEKSTNGQIKTHIPNPFNIYKRKWIKHPAQNNLFPLQEDEKQKIIEDFKNRPQVTDIEEIENYEQWLRLQYGDTFAERFPMQYTPKYWMCEASELETKWVGQRMYQPSLEEVIKGSETCETPVTYYAKEMRYPQKGGFKSFLNELVKDADIRYGENVISIDTDKQTVRTASGNEYKYDRLISSMPLPVIIKALDKSVPQNVKDSAQKLVCTSGYIISIALKGLHIPPYLWWYIYDRDILPARVYSPSLKSSNNVPEGCSSLQLEIYCNKGDYTEEELLQKSIQPLIEMGVIKADDILDVDIRFEPYANIVFDHNIYDSRKVVMDYLASIGIESIGRFGKWEYYWTDQSLLSGLRV